MAKKFSVRGLLDGREEGWLIELYRELRLKLENKEPEPEVDEGASLEIVPLSTVVEEIAEEEKNGKQYGILTMMPTLDEAIEGLNRGELYIIGAATGAGKSLFVQNIAFRAGLVGHRVLFITTEMTAKENVKRIQKMMNSLSEEELPQDNNYPIFFNTPKRSVTTPSLRATLEENMGEPFDLVIIDNLQYFVRSGANEADMIGLATRECKEISRQFDVPVILVSHIRKIYNEEKTPELDDLRGSSFIAQDADAVIVLWRSKEEGKQNMIKCSVQKNRRTGKLADFWLTGDRDTLVLRENVLESVELEKQLREVGFFNGG